MTRDEQKYLKEAEKILGLSIKNLSKQNGFQKIDGEVYKFIDDFVYTCLIYPAPIDLGKVFTVRLGVKPIALDELFWDIFGINEAKKQPKSFHVRGAFTACRATIEEQRVSVEHLEDIETVFINILEQASSIIDSHHNEINTIEQFRDFVAQIPHQELNYVLSEIYLKNYQNALRVIDNEISKGNRGGFVDNNNNSIFTYAKLYCERAV